MKTFYDLTDEEKVVLTEEQVEYYTKLECAERGIIIPLKPIKEIKEIIQPTSKFYQVGYESFVFETEEDAQNYVDAKSKAFQISSIGNDYNSKNQYIKGRLEEHREIKTTTFYTNKESLDLKDTILHNSEAKKELEKYEKALEQSNNIRCDIWNTISEINFKNSKIDHYKRVYNDYLELANNDDKIAYSFFKKAYEKANVPDIDQEIISKMLNEAKPIECE